MTTETENAVATIDTIEQLNPVSIFKAGGIAPIINAIRYEALSEVPDLSTEKGRKAVASNAFKVAKSKTLLDKMGKALADSLNEKLKPINAERKIARDELDKLRDEVRQPLTIWEEDQSRIAFAKIEKEKQKRLTLLREADHEIGLLLHEKYQREVQEAERLEVERVQCELDAETARQKKAVEDAAEAARVEAERLAEEAVATAEREAQDAINRQKETERLAKEQAEQAEADRITEAEKVERDKAEAAALAEHQRLDAIQAEKDRAAEEEAEMVREKEKREANSRHVGGIRKAAKEALMASGITESQAKNVVMLINSGSVPAVSIQY